MHHYFVVSFNEYRNRPLTLNLRYFKRVAGGKRIFVRLTFFSARVRALLLPLDYIIIWVRRSSVLRGHISARKRIFFSHTGRHPCVHMEWIKKHKEPRSLRIIHAARILSHTHTCLLASERRRKESGPCKHHFNHTLLAGCTYWFFTSAHKNAPIYK